ncbi:MAG TPA: GHKL domain-containing protein [Mobilitalea sp.]|nr:GHKL domain-containing protein [Mobilitalea sp.]
MDVISSILQFLIICIECFVYWRILSGALDAKYSKRSLNVAGIIMFSLSFLHQYIFSIPEMEKFFTVGTIVTMCNVFLTFMFLTKNSFVEKVIWFGVFYLGTVIFELLTFFILKLVLNKGLPLSDNDEISMYIVFIGKVLYLLLFEYIIRKRKQKVLISVSYFKELSIIILFNLVLLLASVYISKNQQGIISNIDGFIFFIFTVVFLITSYIVILIFRLEKKSREEIETQLKLQQIELELKLNDDMINVTDKLRKLRHDMNNHIGLIKALVKAQKYDELEEYINQIYEDVEIANELVITSNKTLSVLLNSKKSLAKSKNIDFTSMIASQEINMQNKDICALLGNILDNAIEAAEKSGNKKYILLMIQKTEEGCIISCENSLGIKPIIKKGKFVTLKDNSLLHGIGIENMKDIVTKYKGEINFDYDDEMFHVRIVLPV